MEQFDAFQNTWQQLRSCVEQFNAFQNTWQWLRLCVEQFDAFPIEHSVLGL